MFMEALGIGPGVKLAHAEAAVRRCGDLVGLGIDEGTDRYSGPLECMDDRSELVDSTHDIQSTFCRDLITTLEDKHGHLRLKLDGDPEHLRGGRHLHVQSRSGQILELHEIIVLNMATILTEVERDPMGAAQLCLNGSPGGVGFPGPSGLANGGDMIDVDTEIWHESGIQAWNHSVALEEDHAGSSTPVISSTGRPRDGYTSRGCISFFWCMKSRFMEEFARRHGQLRDDLLTQGDRVVSHAMHAIESFFGNDLEKAGSVIEADRVIDRADIEIERASIKLLMLSPTEEYDIRSVFTIVKINNEFERIADCGVNIAEATSAHDGDAPRSGTFEVMANSVIGMVRDANLALRNRDTALAQRVLDFDDTIDRFRTEVVRLVQAAVQDGTMPLEEALCLLNVNRALERMADHCTNISEQLIYLESGKIVRHLSSGWTQPEEPEKS